METIDQQDDASDSAYNVDGSIYLDALSEQEERRSVDYTGMDGVSDAGSVMVARRGAELVSDTEDDYELSLPPCDYIRQLKSSDQLRDLALLISCTLASVPDGCHANKLRALFHNDWGTTVDDAVQACGYPSFDTFLGSEYMKDYVEVKNITNNSIIYAVKVTPSIQHITQTLADQNLNADQIKMKRKRQRLLELKKVENTEAFIEGKRRILTIMMDLHKLHGYEHPISYSHLQTEYERIYGVCLNSQEQSRMFTSKAALKNIRRVFYNEIDIISQNPLMIKLKSSNVKIPEEISEEDRLRAVGIEDVELPSFSMYDSNADEKSNRQPMPEQTKTVEPRLDNSEGSGRAEATMNWDGEDLSDGSDANEDERKQINNKENYGKNASTMKTSNIGGGKFTDDETDDDSSDDESTHHSQLVSRPSSSKMPVRQSTSTVELIEPEAESDRNVTPLNGQPFHNRIGSSDSKSVETSLLSQTPKKKGVTARALLRSIQEGQSNWIGSEPSQESHGRKIASQRDNYNCAQYETPKFSSAQNHSDLLSMNKADSERAYREHQNVNRRNEVDMSHSASATASNRSFTSQSRAYPDQCFKGFGGDGTLENENYGEGRQNMQGSSGRADKKNSETQTEFDWLDSVLSELGITNEPETSTLGSPSNFGSVDGSREDRDILDLARLIDFVIRAHAPKPVLLSELPEIVGKVYGRMIIPNEDRIYRLSWTELIERYCCKYIKSTIMPNNETAYCYGCDLRR